MNEIVQFRKCTLSDQELIKKIDKATDNIFETGKLPPRHIPAHPNDDYDLIVGELIYRFNESTELLNKVAAELKSLYKKLNINNSNILTEIEKFLD